MANKRNGSVHWAGEVVTGAAAKFDRKFKSRSTEGPTIPSLSHSSNVLSTPVIFNKGISL